MLERTTRADPENSEALNGLGIAYAREGKGGAALAAFNRALAADPRDVYAHENIGTVYLQQNDYAAARAAFVRALENEPRSSRAHAGLGVVDRQQGRIDDAIGHWRTAVEIDPRNFDALFNLSTALVTAGRGSEARPYMTQFVQTAPAAFYGPDIERFKQFLAGSRMMMGRRIVLIVAAVAILAAGAWLYWSKGPAPGTAITSNGPVILISIDTLRADRLPAYGYKGTQTPAIDRLIADGVLFENAYSHSPQTLPAHTSILSGQLPFEHGVRDNVGFTVKPEQRFVQHALKDAGFATGGFVSSYVLRRQVGFNLGFDQFDDEMPPAAPDRSLGQMQRAGMDTLAAANIWLDKQPSPKLFLFFHIYEPHRPYAPPQHIKAGNRLRRRGPVRGRDRRQAAGPSAREGSLRHRHDRPALGPW